VTNQTLGLPPFKNQHSKSLLAIFASALMLIGSTNIHAAMFSQELLSSFTENNIAHNSQTPSIDTEGRLGAEAFSGAQIPQGKAGLIELEKIARAEISRHPKSGLAHEVLGTTQFYSGDLAAAAIEFIAATKLEPQQSGPWTKLGITQMELNQLPDAEQSLLTAIKLTPDNRVAHQRLGLLYEYQQKNALAIESFQKGLQGTSNDYLGVALNLGRLLNQANRYAGTIQLLADRVPLNSSVAEAHTILGTAYLATKQYDAALQHFSKAHEISPDTKESLLGMAISQRKKADNTAALKTSAELVNKYPDWRSAHLEQGEIFLQTDQLSLAEKSFTKAVSFGTNPNSTNAKLADYHSAHNNPTQAKMLYQKIIASDTANPRIYVKLAELLRSENQLDSSSAILRDGTLKYPQSSYLHFRLANELAATRHYPQALTSIEKANKLLPNDASILRSYSLILSKVGKSAESAQVAGQLYKLPNSGTPEALYYATQLQANKQLQEAAEIYLEVINKEAENLVALNNLAATLSEQGKLNDAEHYARKANNLIKDNAQIMDTLGWILYQQKRYSEATVLFTEAITIAPKAAVIHYHAGVTLNDSGKSADAIPHLKQALALDADAIWANDAKHRLTKIN
jgi:tetratricopeptide (TPR) repeat protein